jgi:hypothetical protein
MVYVEKLKAKIESLNEELKKSESTSKMESGIKTIQNEEINILQNKIN